jgi:adenine deaminase
MEVAQGLRPADLYIRGGRVVNVYSGEVLPANVAVQGRRIAYIGTLDHMVGPQTQVLEAAGGYLLPGFIDPHGHTDFFHSPVELAREVLPRGTTAIFGDCLPSYSMLSLEDFDLFLRTVTHMPLKLFFGARPEPPCFWEPERGELFTEERLVYLLGREEFFGIAEYTPWYRTLQEPELVARVLLARQRGKRVEGHLAGCSYERMNAVVDAGITSCHEAINAQQALDRLRLGLWTILRQSSVRPDLADLIRIVTEQGVNTSRLMLTPDGPEPTHLVRYGHLDHLLRLVIAYGVEPVTAIQMATLNPATYYGLEEHLGGLGPGRLADIVLVRDLREPRAELVIADGQVVAREGKLLASLPETPWYQRASNPYREARPALHPSIPELFRIPAAEAPQPFPVIELVNGIITRRVDIPWRERGGYLTLEGAPGVLRLALVMPQSGRVVNGFLAGFGAHLGGLATTMNVAKQLLVLGQEEDDMALAAGRVLEMGGGIALAEGGRILHELPYPIGGLFGWGSVRQSAASLEAIEGLLRGRGFPYPSLYYTLHFLPTNHLLHIRLTVRGIYDVKDQRVLCGPRPISSFK